MLIIIDETTVLNMKEVNTMLLAPNKKIVKKKISGGFFGIDKTVEIEEQDGYKLSIEYVDNRDRQMIYSCTHSDYATLQAKGKIFIEQLKMLDTGIINAAFEDAFLKDPK
jgi:hypothetical protein